MHGGLGVCLREITLLVPVGSVHGERTKENTEAGDECAAPKLVWLHNLDTWGRARLSSKR